MRKFFSLQLLLCFLLLSASQSWGQLLQWNTFGNTGTEATEPSVFNNVNIAAANLIVGPGVTPSSNANRLGGSGWFDAGNSNPSTISEAIAGNNYIEFTVTPNAGFSFTPTSFVFNWDKSGTGPQNVALRSSADAYASDLGTVAPTGSIGTSNTITISGLTNLTTATTFRVYGYGATATGGTGGFDISSNVVNVQLNGTTASTTPADIAISAGGIGASNVNQGALNVVLQRYDLAVTTSNTVLNGLTVTTAGTYAASDVNNLKVRYSTDATLDAGDATLSTKTTGLGAGSQVFPSFVNQAISSGNTGYVFVTADISGSATSGNAINVAATPFSNISFSGSTNKSGTDPVPAGGSKTFVAVTPDVVLSSPNPAVPAASLAQNTNNNVIYRFDLAVSTANAELDGVSVTTAGSYVAADVNNFKCWYSADNTFDAGSDILLSTKTTGLDGGLQIFPSFTNRVITNGSTGYILITTDIPCAATEGHTITVNAITTSDISFLSANKSGTANAGGTQTIASATPNNVTTPAANNLDMSSSVSWTNPSGCFDEIMIVAATATNSGTPSGDGSLYTPSLTYGNGTPLGNGYVVYKGSSSPQTIVGLTNGTTYYFKIFTRNDQLWSAGTEVTATPALQVQPGEVLINQMSPDYGAATDEYVELVNTTGRSIDLSTLKLNYRSASGGGTNSQTLTGTILPHSYWLLASSATVTVGKTQALSRDGTLAGGFAGSDGQMALLRISDDTQIDGLGYGTLTGGTYAETAAAPSPTTDGGLRRVIDGADANNNNTDFITVDNLNIYLKNSSSRLANAGASIVAGTYSNLIVTGNSSLAGNVTVTDKVEAQAGTLTTNNNLTLQSTSAKTARIANSAGSITGNVIVERYIPASGRRAWRLLGAPLVSTGAPTILNSWQENGTSPNGFGTHITQAGGANTNGFDASTIAGASSIRYWNGTTLLTPSNTNATAITDHGAAYFLFVRGDRNIDLNNASASSNTTLRMAGTVNQGNVTAGVAGTTFSLIPNPYPAPVDYEAVYGSNPFSVYYAWDANLGTTGAYRTIERTGANTYQSTPSTGGAATDNEMRYIRSGQAFFVSGNTTFNFTEAMKTDMTPTTNVYRTGAGTEEMTIDLKVVGATTYLADGVRAKYNNSYSNAVDANDIVKFSNFNENLGIVRDNQTLAVEKRDLVDNADTIFLKLWNTGIKNYQFDINPSSFSPSANLAAYLKDNYLNTTTAVSLSANTLYDFSVTSDAGSAANDRFMIVFRASTPLPANFTTVKAYQKENGIQVEWNVASQENVVRYEVEKSINGTSFDAAGAVTANSNSKSYSWFDATPNNGANFYRIKVINKDNSYQYSNVVNVKIGNTKGDISVYPNPVKGSVINVQFNNQEKGIYTVQLFNSIGQQVYSGRIVHNGGSSSQTLQLNASLTKGVYQLVVTNGEEKVTQQVVAE